MRRLDLTFSALNLPFDFLALCGAAVTAYALRFSQMFLEMRPILQALPFPAYLTTATFFSLLGLGLFAVAGLYAIKPRPLWSDLGRVVLAVTSLVMLVIVGVFFRREFTTSRFIVLAVWPLAIVYTGTARIVLRLIRRALISAGFGHQRIALIGQGKTADELHNLYRHRPALGYHVVKTVKTWNRTAERALELLCVSGQLDELLLAETTLSKEEALNIIAFAEAHNLRFRYLADPFSARFTNIEMSAPGGIPIIELKRTRLDGWGRIAKRLFDVLASGLLIVLLSPVMLATVIAIKLDSDGPIFFHLDNDEFPERIGEGGQPFKYLKFRSMFHGTHDQRYHELTHLDLRTDGPLVKLKNDPRITRVGRITRKWSLDELSELFSVFVGRMSLVGPRPHEPEEVAKYEPHHRRVLDIKPGITGMAQVSGRSNLEFEDEINLDTWYIENWSPWLDLSILLRTPLAVFRHRHEEGV